MALRLRTKCKLYLLHWQNLFGFFQLAMVAQKIFRSLAIFLNDKVFEQKRNVKNQHRDS
jgi:hypothetical protein